MLHENEQNYNSKLTDISTEVSQLTNRIKFLTLFLGDKMAEVLSLYDDIKAREKGQLSLLLDMLDKELPKVDYLSYELTSARVELQKLSKQLENKAYYGGDRK